MDNKQAVSQLLDFVRTKLQTYVGLDTPSDELTLQTAKELKLVVGKRGRDGGTFPTDEGLKTIGVDVASYRATETTLKAAKTRATTKVDTTTTDTTVPSDTTTNE